jgi:hypothetical protein
MKILDVERQSFYVIVDAVFKHLGIRPVALELGVYDGGNAKRIFDSINPKFLYLIDAWRASLMSKSYYPFEPVPKWVDKLNSKLYNHYYGGNPLKQETFENLYNKTVEIFKDFQNIKIIRDDSLSAHQSLSNYLGNEKIDYMYIDGNHQFEYVFNDLMIYSEYCSENAIIQMNDCCFSEAGLRQNLGVLEACTKFIKVSDWRPLVINRKNFSDLILTRDGSSIGNAINQLLVQSDVPYFEVPDSLLGGCRLMQNSRGVLSMSFI